MKKCSDSYKQASTGTGEGLERRNSNGRISSEGMEEEDEQDE